MARYCSPQLSVRTRLSPPYRVTIRLKVFQGRNSISWAKSVLPVFIGDSRDHPGSLLRLQIVDTAFRSETRDIPRAQSRSPSVNRTAVGVHGVLQGPDPSDPDVLASKELAETWAAFQAKAKQAGKTAKSVPVSYHAPSYQDWITDLKMTPVDVDNGAQRLNDLMKTLIANCPTQNIVLAGYSFGSWVINRWIYLVHQEENRQYWPSLANIAGVELYGDPLWEHSGYDYSSGKNYYSAGPAVVLGLRPYNNSPQGPGADISEKWQSRCLYLDPVCGEGYLDDPLHLVLDLSQLTARRDATETCRDTNCPHVQYTLKHYDPKTLASTLSCNY